ncbi:MAG: SPFH domain-containing protein [Phycisphaerales bacterium]
MKADSLSFSRATGVSLLGLTLQVAIGTGAVVYGILARDTAGLHAGYLILSGGLVWLCLALVFDQHRRERLEAMETDALAAGGAGGIGRTSVFDSAAEELHVAARRLAWMHRFLMPAASLVLATVQVTLGLSLLRASLKGIGPDVFVAPAQRGWAVSVGLGAAVVGFVFARFVSGMAKQPAWANLRGGAGAAACTALVGLLLGLAHFLQYVGSDWMLRHLAPAMDGLMILLGVETFLNFLLNLYRPRKQGEVPRPAFDSRFLSFIASPDRLAESVGGAISYQFGVDVTGSWAYRLLSRSVLLLGVVVALVLWGTTALEQVEPHEQAVQVRTGRMMGVAGPGLHAKWPWPFEVFESQATTSLRRDDLMTGTPVNAGPILWTNDHKTEEVYAIVQPTPLSAQAASGGGGGAGGGGASEAGVSAVRDIALVAVEVPLIWRINDLAKFDAFADPATRDGWVKAAARGEVVRYLASLNEDQVLGGGRTEASNEMRRLVQARLDTMGAGIEVVFAGLEGVHPDKEAAKYFEAVVENQQQGQGAIEQGRTRAIETLTEAVGSVDLARQIAAEIDKLDSMRGQPQAQMDAQTLVVEDLVMKAGGKAGAAIERARADRWTRHMTERGRAEAYVGQSAAYQAQPEVYKAALYFQMLKDLMAGARVFITPPDPWIILDLKDVDTGGNVLANPVGDVQ